MAATKLFMEFGGLRFRPLDANQRPIGDWIDVKEELVVPKVAGEFYEVEYIFLFSGDPKTNSMILNSDFKPVAK